MVFQRAEVRQTMKGDGSMKSFQSLASRDDERY